MAKHSLKLLFLRKYRTHRNYLRPLKWGTEKSESNCNYYNYHQNQNNSDLDHHHVNLQQPSNSRRSRKNETPSVDTVDCCWLICDCLQHCKYKLKTFVCILIIGILSTTGIYYHNQKLIQFTFYNFNYNEVDRADIRLFSEAVSIHLKRCVIPRLQPFAAEIRRFVVYSPRPSCLREQRSHFDEIPFILRNGSLLVRNSNISESSFFEGCCYKAIHRSGDSGVWSSNICKDLGKKEINQISNGLDYIEIMCTSEGTNFRDGFPLIHRKDQVEDRVKGLEEIMTTEDKTNRMNVIILGLDATSHMNFVRAMPRSYRYLSKNLSAIVLKGYTKVAENTLPNVVPLLTGKTLDEFKHLCVDETRGTGNVHLDGCPFIWKVFARNGYRTSFNEDDVNIGIFNMNWQHAFVRPPTDYYLRPFSMHMQKHHSFKNGYCYGPSLSFEKLLENVRAMAETFPGQGYDHDPYFQFSWSTKLSHDDFNKMKWGDQPLLELLQTLHSGGHLNNTALLVLGDHGSRIERIRSTSQGQLEDRMPVAILALPEWFRTKYPRAYRNLQDNSNKVTSAFDMYKTLYSFMNVNSLENVTAVATESENGDLDLMVLPNNHTVSLKSLRGSNLFQALSSNRTCFTAGVPLHWCVCQKKVSTEKNSDLSREAAEFVVAWLNTLLEKHHDCATLTLQAVNEVSKWDSSEIIQEGCDNSTKNVSQNQLCNNGNSKADLVVLQVAFTTSPSKATFETTLIQLGQGHWKITEEVVRTNSYEGQSSCVEQKLKPYCYCIAPNDSFMYDLF